jgi:MoaA/NifB/PqqE/SkfB family radical SAM enzyme
VGRKGAYKELIKASEILIENGIEPRWQIFIYETNKDEVIELLELAKRMNIKEIIVHEGSCDGNNRKLYDVRINKTSIPNEVKPYYLDYPNILSEKECIDLLKDDKSHYLPHNENEIVLYITSNLNVYFNFTNPSPAWKIGNIKDDDIDVIVRRVIDEDIPALMLSKTITIKELIKKYGNKESDKVFSINDYKMYLLNNYLDEKYNAQKELENLVSDINKNS